VRRRRLALLGSRGIPARYGGFETFAEELGARLVARGHEVTVFCLAESGCPRPREHRGVRLEHLRVPRLGPLGTLLYDLRALRRARAHDVVYMLGYGAGAFLGLARAAENELWINMDGLEWRRAKWGRLARAWLVRMERRALLAADRVVFDSAAVRARVAPAEDPRVSVIPYGATLEVAPDPRTLADLGLRRHGYFLVVARFEPENHVLEILRAHARAPELALVLVGDVARAGRYGAACRAAAGPGVRFLGALHDAQALRALRGEAAAVLHGHSVGGTNPSLLEAMAAGAPVVAHDNPFNREVLGEAGAFFADAGELEARLRAVAHWDEAERARCGALHRARVGERYTWERVVAAYVELLERPAPPRVPAARRSLAEERAR
jgi:glycosyltransferase involved in cell wall biosynthesis